MNLTEHKIEGVLRRAPQAKPPADLKHRLIAQIKLPATPFTPATRPLGHLPGGWFRRWWQVLAPATACLVCVVVLAVQRMEIQNLEESVQLLSQAANAQASPLLTTEPTTQVVSGPDAAAAEQEEIRRLKERVSELTGQIARLEQIRTENASLRQQLATPPGLTVEELDAVNKAREKALSIKCINNLKQFGLAVRQWALDNAHVSPPDVVCMSNELNTAKILLCPADTNRVATSNWASFTAANLSYEYLSPSATNMVSVDPTRVLSRCPLHGHMALCDGSVWQVDRKHPEWLVEREGKLYYEHGTSPTKP